MAPSTTAASATVRAIVPTVSWVREMGMTPARLVRPPVGFTPTMEHAADGQTTEPSVSVSSASAHRLAATAAADPELEPHVERSRA